MLPSGNGLSDCHIIQYTQAENYFRPEISSKFALLKIQDGGRPPYWSSIQSASPIFKKFDRQMIKNIFVMLVTFNTRLLRNQDGNRPPSWISVRCDNLITA
jgi:hypothetical protein